MTYLINKMVVNMISPVKQVLQKKVVIDLKQDSVDDISMDRGKARRHVSSRIPMLLIRPEFATSLLDG